MNHSLYPYKSRSLRTDRVDIDTVVCQIQERNIVVFTFETIYLFATI